MNKDELIEILKEVAEKDLVDGKDIFDHPCSVAIRAITQYDLDIRQLKGLAKGSERGKSKQVQTLVRGVYHPTW